MSTTIVATTWQEDLTASCRRIAAGVLGGFVAGAVVGGIGGRIAMFVLRLTSDPALHGRQTDDGFVIGELSSATLFLVGFTAALGVLGALFYLVVRGWLPATWRAPLAGVFGGIVGGALVIQPGGIDFTLLEPLWLAIAMFIALPALFGVVMSLLVERFRAPDSGFARSRVWFLGLVPLIAIVFSGVRVLAVAAVVLAAWLLRRAVPDVAAWWRSAPVVWTGRVALVAFTGWALTILVSDVIEIL
ncbi:MAG TPA: hypothetical protein VIB62_11175 [Actinomycetota bacterium]